MFMKINLKLGEENYSKFIEICSYLFIYGFQERGLKARLQNLVTIFGISHIGTF